MLGGDAWPRKAFSPLAAGVQCGGFEELADDRVHRAGGFAGGLQRRGLVLIMEYYQR